MAQGDKPPSFGAFDERLKRLRGGPKGTPKEPAARDPERVQLSQGFQAGVEVLAGVAGGALLGYGLDSWFGTSPGFMIGCFVLGAAAGVLNAYRTLRRFMVGGSGGSPPGNGPSRDLPERDDPGRKSR